jgi:hypothetical protein
MSSDKQKIDEANLNAPDPKAAKEARKIAAAPTPGAATVGGRPLVTRSEHCCVSHFWAVIETDGTLVRGRNVVRSKRLATGQYEVVFTEDVSRGVYVASIGRPGIATEPSGQIGVALRCCLAGAETNKGVWVDTHDSNGAWSDRAFHVVVHLD